MNINNRNSLFLLICICLPFLFIPKVLQLNFVGGPIGSELIVYPIIMSYGYTLYCQHKFKNVLVDIPAMKKFICVYLFTLFLSLIWGLWHYPYYDLIMQGPADQIGKLPAILVFFRHYGLELNKQTAILVWMAARFIKGIFLDAIYTFGFSYMVYCWFKRDPQKAVQILQKSIRIIMPIILTYSFVEIFYLLGYDWAKNVLVKITPFLHTIGENFDWWPPLLWVGRVRSIFPEPSQFAMYGNFVLPFLWMDILNGNRVKYNLGTMLLLAVLMYLSSSKTAIGLLIGEFFLLFLYVAVKHKRELFKKCMVILATLLLAFGLSTLIINNYNSKSFILDFNEKVEVNHDDNITDSMKIYVKDNFIGITDGNSGSNSTRFAIIKSDMRIGLEHWLLGVGLNLKSAYTYDYLTNSEKRNSEIELWKKTQDKYGVLKSGYPSVCEFSRRFAETGVAGLLIYSFPVFTLLWLGWRNRKNYSVNIITTNMVICSLIALIGSFAAALSGLLTTIHTYWLLLGICFALIRSYES